MHLHRSKRTIDVHRKNIMRKNPGVQSVGHHQAGGFSMGLLGRGEGATPPLKSRRPLTGEVLKRKLVMHLSRNADGRFPYLLMNTVFDREVREISIAPEFFTYRYKMSGLDNHGVESSMAVYDGYGYFIDNSGFINCIDLNSLQPVWSRNLGDDSDVTPVLALEDDRVVLYIATEVDWQKEIVGNYQGKRFCL